ncbi:WD40 repeat-like protein, partial [Dichomitus squalens LYAD-421 SS1]|uniref:WD40 repeat-like protein n=1 Tax=Dichomitus squalens (strain LYAD-421) TaxID=732165 RepID=UPI000441426A
TCVAGKPGHDAVVTTLVISSDGSWVATASDDSTIILWDARDACISQQWIAHDGEVHDLAFSPDSRYIASAGGDRTVAIWDISGSAHQVASLQDHVIVCNKCAWSSDGAYIASRDGNTIRLWDARTFRLLPLNDAEKTKLNELLFSPDRRWLLIHNGNACGVWDVVSGAYLAFPLQRYNERYSLRAAFNPKSSHIAVGYDDGKLHVWNVATGQEPLFWQAHENRPVRYVVFSPDGRLLLSTAGKVVKTWDADTCATVQSLEGHKSWMTEACFSPCGKYIASASNDETVRVWKTSDGACLATLSDHGPWVSHVAFTPDGTMLWSAAGDGTV